MAGWGGRAGFTMVIVYVKSDVQLDKREDVDLEKTVDTVGEGECGMNEESSVETYTLPYVKQPVGICWMRDVAQTGALWWPGGVRWGGRWEWTSRGWGHMSTYGWLMLIYGRNQYKIVEQLSSNEKKKKTWVQIVWLGQSIHSVALWDHLHCILSPKGCYCENLAANSPTHLGVRWGVW